VRRISRAALIAAALVSVVAASAQAPTPGDDAPAVVAPTGSAPTDPALATNSVESARAAADAFRARRDELRQAAAQRVGEWDGSYSYGNGAATRDLVYVEGKGYVDQSGGCVGGYSSFGAVERREDRIWLRSSQPPRLHMADDLSTTPLLPVSWGERRFLIEQDRIGDFILAVYYHDFSQCLLESDIYGYFLLLDGDATKPVSGLPQLPAAWQGQWRREPVRLRVTAMTVEEDVYAVEARTRRLRYSLTLDAGRDHGLVPGLRLMPSGWRWLLGEFPLITSVQDTTSVATITHVMGNSGPPPAPGAPALLGSHPTDFDVIGPVVGYEFTTGALPDGADPGICAAATASQNGSK
jgi:hypothetical protein